MAPGDGVLVGTLRLAFVEVSRDSRCPIDVVCVWQGNAAIEIRAGLESGRTFPFTLNTSEPDVPADLGTYRIRLLYLLPAARSDRSIPPGDYRAAFRVELLADR